MEGIAGKKRKRRRAKSAPTEEEKEDENSEEAKFDAWTRSLELEKYNDFCPGEGSSSTAAPVEISPEKVASLKAPPHSVLCPSTPLAKKKTTEGGSRGFAGASCIAQGGIATGLQMRWGEIAHRLPRQGAVWLGHVRHAATSTSGSHSIAPVRAAMADIRSDCRQGIGSAISVGTVTGIGATAATGAIAQAMIGSAPRVAIIITGIGGFAMAVTRLARNRGHAL